MRNPIMFLTSKKIMFSTVAMTVSMQIAVAQNWVERLDTAINSEYHESGAVVSADGKTLYFQRRNHPENMNELDDVWRSERIGDHWTAPVRLPAPVNNLFFNAPVGISGDGKHLLLKGLYQDSIEKAVIWIASRTSGDNFREPRPLPITRFYNRKMSNDFWLNGDASLVLMCVDGQLLFSQKNELGRMTQPQNMGEKLNTINAPNYAACMSADEKTIYFAARRNGIRLQIFTAKRLDETWQNWTNPQLVEVENISMPNEVHLCLADGWLYFNATDLETLQSDIFRLKIDEKFDVNAIAIAEPRQILAQQQSVVVKKGDDEKNAAKEINYQNDENRVIYYPKEEKIVEKVVENQPIKNEVARQKELKIVEQKQQIEVAPAQEKNRETQAEERSTVTQKVEKTVEKTVENDRYTGGGAISEKMRTENERLSQKLTDYDSKSKIAKKETKETTKKSEKKVDNSAQDFDKIYTQNKVVSQKSDTTPNSTDDEIDNLRLKIRQLQSELTDIEIELVRVQDRMRTGQTAASKPVEVPQQHSSFVKKTPDEAAESKSSSSSNSSGDPKLDDLRERFKQAQSTLPPKPKPSYKYDELRRKGEAETPVAQSLRVENSGKTEQKMVEKTAETPQNQSEVDRLRAVFAKTQTIEQQRKNEAAKQKAAAASPQPQAQTVEMSPKGNVERIEKNMNQTELQQREDELLREKYWRLQEIERLEIQIRRMR
ncbi:MAG: hypothetical protein RL757_2992 [Bacteroidota bacterium]